MSILARSRNPHSARPVVVKMGELVGESLDVLGHQTGGVLHYVVGCGVHSALVHRLGHEEEVVPRRWIKTIIEANKEKPLRQGHVTVHHSATWRVRRLPIHPGHGH